MKTCPQCKKEFTGYIGSNYCTDDGTLLLEKPRCPQCDDDYVGIPLYCRNCGANLALARKEEERNANARRKGEVHK